MSDHHTTSPPLRLRRNFGGDARIEMLPLIDVIFLVLTFFIYAMVLMIPAKVLPMRLAEVPASATASRSIPAITISLDAAGNLFVDRQSTTLDDVLATVQAAVANSPDAVVYIAAAEDSQLDRLPLFIEVYGQLSEAGLDIRLVGRRGGEEVKR